MGRRWKEGLATLWAWWRQGNKELAQVLPAFPNQSVQPVNELGGFCCPTQQEVNQLDGNFEQWLKERQEAATQEREDPGLDLER
ncbi:MAG TPA: hypothetical protein VMF30_13655 [Pirellulales bacterium]|nr:hypothetical protein [Pirellulales bacterium]